jgi:hypothetical protein
MKTKRFLLAAFALTLLTATPSAKADGAFGFEANVATETTQLTKYIGDKIQQALDYAQYILQTSHLLDIMNYANDIQKFTDTLQKVTGEVADITSFPSELFNSAVNGIGNIVGNIMGPLNGAGGGMGEIIGNISRTFQNIGQIQAIGSSVMNMGQAFQGAGALDAFGFFNKVQGARSAFAGAYLDPSMAAARYQPLQSIISSAGSAHTIAEQSKAQSELQAYMIREQATANQQMALQAQYEVAQSLANEQANRAKAAAYQQRTEQQIDNLIQ